MVYTAAAGVFSDQLLPISVDVGCNVDSVREHPLYMGLQQVWSLLASVTAMCTGCLMSSSLNKHCCVYMSVMSGTSPECTFIL